MAAGASSSKFIDGNIGDEDHAVEPRLEADDGDSEDYENLRTAMKTVTRVV